MSARYCPQHRTTCSRGCGPASCQDFVRLANITKEKAALQESRERTRWAEKQVDDWISNSKRWQAHNDRVRAERIKKEGGN